MMRFTSERVSEHLTRIIAPCGVCMYLAEGTQQAVLMDTGFGLGDLRGCVESLTDKPCLVLLSHGHLDHAGGAGQFETVYLNERDWELEKWHATLERRVWDVSHRMHGIPEGMTAGDFVPSRTIPYLPIDEGDDFALGGVTIRPIAVPGHTMGSLVFLIPEDRTAIFGDACGENTLLLFAESAPIAAYREGLLHLRQFEAQYDTVLCNHGSFCVSKQVLADNIELCGDILAGRDAAVPKKFFAQAGCLGRPEEHPGKAGNILYDPNKKR